MAADTWHSRDLPVLETAVQMLDDRLSAVAPKAIADALGMPIEDVSRALVALSEEYLDVVWGNRVGGIGKVRGATSAGRRAAGQWPSPQVAADRVLEVIEQRIEAASSAEERSRWVKVRDAVGGAGRDLLVDVMGSVISRQMGGV